MTPKEKSLELVGKYKSITNGKILFVYTTESAKLCALIAVDEILNEFPQGFKGNFEERRKQYWDEVKQEIENL